MRRSTLLFFALVATACADKTAIVVEVSSSDVTIPDDVDTLRIVARSASGQMADRTFRVSHTWPHSLTILPGNDRSGAVTLTVMGMLAGSVKETRVVTTAFMPGVVRHVPVPLSHDCLGVVCDMGVDCTGGHCTAVVMDGGHDDAGVDGGIEVDAGIDGGPPIMDDSGIDAGPDMDSGTDAGPMMMDSGTDAGPMMMDAGMPVDSGTMPRCSLGAPCVGLLVISELATRGPSGAADEFVEIYNRSTQTLDVGSVELYYLSMSGAGSTRSTIPAGQTMAPGAYYLFGSAGFSGPTPDAPTRWVSGFVDTGATLEIRGGTTAIDIAAWGDASIVDMSAYAPVLSSAALTAGASYERKAHATSTTATMGPGGTDELAGNGSDTDNNLVDFTTRALRDPQTSLSPVEP